MASEYILAPNARWQGRDQTGQPCAFGKLYTYLNETVVPKATYQDYRGLQPNTNPVILDGKGEANIYWATNELYTIKLFTFEDDEVYTQDNYPVVGTEEDALITFDENNIARNAQFYFWNYGTTFTDIRSSQSPSDYFANDWIFGKVSTTSVINITRETFTLDQTDVPQNPTYFFRYSCTTAGTGETNVRIGQSYKSVNTLAGQRVTLSFYAKSSSASQLNLYMVQDFGTGGTPSAEVATLAVSATLTSNWQRYSVEALLIPTLAGKSIGSNGDDFLGARFNFPNDSLAQIDICDFFLQASTTLAAFPFQSIDTQFKELDSMVNNGVFTTGDVKPTFKPTADSGWLMMNDQTIGNVASAATSKGISLQALYILLWNNVLDAWAPVSTGRGASGFADWNANKTLTLTRQLGRVMGSAGSGAGLATPRVLGEYLGEEKHTMTLAELVAHHHQYIQPNSGGVGGSPNGSPTTSLGDTTSTGSSTPFNVMQPSSFVNHMIKI